MESLRRTNARRIVIASSGGTVYGPVDELPTSEDAFTRPISLHGVNSLAIEGYAAFYAREHGMRPLILRYSKCSALASAFISNRPWWPPGVTRSRAACPSP